MYTNEFVIISAERSNLDWAQNFDRTQRLAKTLEVLGLPYKRVSGCYNGATDASFVVELNWATQASLIMHVAGLLEQELVLYVDSYRGASLEFTGGGSQFLGRLRGVHPEAAGAYNSYTLDKTNNLAWVTI